MVRLKVTANWQVFEQHVSYCIARPGVGSAKLVKLISEQDELVLDVVAKESADLEFMLAPDFGEIVLPDEKVFMIIPGRRVRQRCITVCSPERRKW